MGQNEIALKLTPGGGGDLKVFLDGEKLFDKRAEGNIYPERNRVKKMQGLLREKLAKAGAAA